MNATCDDSSGDPTRRFLEIDTNSTNATLVEKIRDAIDSVNSALSDVGITINGSVAPYFVGSKFAVGVNTTLSVTFVSKQDHFVCHLLSFITDLSCVRYLLNELEPDCF